MEDVFCLKSFSRVSKTFPTFPYIVLESHQENTAGLLSQKAGICLLQRLSSKLDVSQASLCKITYAKWLGNRKSQIYS